MTSATTHGGKRSGAGRPKGSRGRRSEILAETLLAQGKCPVEALIRLAEKAEAEGELALAIGAWKSIVPYVYPKPKAVEIEPETVIELAKAVAEARATPSGAGIHESYGVLLDRRIREKREREAKEVH
jgi:hypothetical protein